MGDCRLRVRRPDGLCPTYGRDPNSAEELEADAEGLEDEAGAAVRGKDFCREKNKRKRTFNGFSKSAGGSITLTSFSTKYHYSDDE